MPDDKQDKQDIVLCGNPGLGKSTILTSISGMKFESGISWGTGLTSKLQFQCSDKDPNVRFADTPGLADIEMAEKAAEAITEALKDAAENNTTVKIFFVVSCEAGRVRPEDFYTINNVMGAINTPDGNKPGMNTHGVIVNKCDFLDQPGFKAKGKDIVEKSFSTKSDMNKYPTLYIKFLPREEGLVNASNRKGNFDGLVEWMDTFPGLEVGSVDIIDVSKIEEKLEEMKKVHKKAMDDLEKKLKGDHEKALADIKAEARKTQEDKEFKMKAMETFTRLTQLAAGFADLAAVFAPATGFGSVLNDAPYAPTRLRASTPSAPLRACPRPPRPNYDFTRPPRPGGFNVPSGHGNVPM